MRIAKSIGALVLACAGALAWATDQAPEAASGYTEKHAVTAHTFMVAAANPLAVDAGVAMLKRGGSAVDAAIATQLVLNLVEPQSSGIGGGAFMLFHDAAQNRLITYDGRETAPRAATPEMFLGADGKPVAFYDAVVGGRSVGVPGTLRLLETAHRAHGRLPWAQLFEPAIALAEQGFAVSPRLAGAIAREQHLLREPARSYFFHADGSPLKAGERLRNPAFAEVLKLVAARGADAFYQGEIARNIVRSVREHPTNPGTMTEEDLARYTVKVREPVCGAYRQFRVCGMGPPSSGGVALLQILGVLERFPVGRWAPDSVDAVHYFSEAGRLAYADRNRYLADPDFVPVPAGLLDRGYLAARSQLIRDDASLGKAEPGTPPAQAAWRFGEAAALERPSTSHISVVDAAGNAVSMTTTIEDGFGSRQMVRGFLLNNELTDFAFAPVVDGQPVANRIEPGKRPRSSMAPTIVYDADGRLRLVIGSPGGSAIINYVAKSVIGVLDWQLDVQQAISLPNVGSRNGPTELEEGSAAAGLQAALEKRGHTVKVIEFNSGVQGIERIPDGWRGGADPRREGIAAGD